MEKRFFIAETMRGNVQFCKNIEASCVCVGGRGMFIIAETSKDGERKFSIYEAVFSFTSDDTYIIYIFLSFFFYLFLNFDAEMAFFFF